VSAIGVDTELDRYIEEASDNATEDSLGFWREQEPAYSLLASLAQGYVLAPASRAYVEQAFTCAQKHDMELLLD